MTGKEAAAAIYKAVAADIKDFHSGTALYKKAMPKLTKGADSLEAELKKGETGDFMQVTLSTMEQPMTDLAQAMVILSRGVKAVSAYLKSNPEVAAAVPKEFLADFRQGVEAQERMRNMLRRAKELKDKAEVFISQQSKDSDAAGEDWSAALALFDGACRNAAADLKALTAWEKNAQAALEARNKPVLDKLVKALPACPGLDAVAAMPAGKPFQDFDKRYDVASLSSDLQDEISLDRGKAMNDYDKALKMVAARDTIVARVKAMRMDARDGLKALKVLDLPKNALTKLQAALDGPDSVMVKSLDAVGKLFKSELSGKDMQLALRKAAVI